MRIVILSDIHSNLAALEAVLRQAQSQGVVDGVWCLGDTVGYGPQPGECIARLRELGVVAVVGNHDRAATGGIGTEEFNPQAAAAARWTAERLSAEEKSFLDGLPEVESQGDFTLVHGTLRWPMWEYLYNHEAAWAHLERQETPFGLVGHTHVPMLVVEGREFENGCEMSYLEDGERVQLSRGRKQVVNPGGVGQPRDGDPRASYVLYDSDGETVTLHRVEYDIAATQKLMAEARLPAWLSERLAIGR